MKRATVKPCVACTVYENGRPCKTARSSDDRAVLHKQILLMFAQVFYDSSLCLTPPTDGDVRSVAG